MIADDPGKTPRGCHPNSRANLMPAWTGSGNPRGRPPGSKSLTEHLKALQGKSLEFIQKAYEDESDLTRMAAARIRLVMAGKLEGARLREGEILAAFSEVADRTEGKPIQVQKIEGSVLDHRPIVLDTTRLPKRVESSAKPLLGTDTGTGTVAGAAQQPEMPSGDGEAVAQGDKQ